MKCPIISSIPLVLIASVSLSALGTAPAFADNLSAALSQYGADRGAVVEAAPSDLVTALSDAGTQSSSESIRIVHAGAGAYTAGELVVPENVVLVAEQSAKFSAKANSNILVVRGSVYGGTYIQGSDKSKDAILCYKRNYSGKNGRVEKAVVVSNSKGRSDAGILVYGCKNVIVRDCSVDKALNGIRISGGSTATEISGNKITSCGSGSSGSGIDIMSSDVSVIAKNKVTGCLGHGISTGLPSTGKNPGLRIGEVVDNVIQNNGHQGFYVEGGTKVEKLAGNMFSGNGTGLAIRSNVHSYGKYTTTHWTTYVKAADSNKFVSNKGSNISVIGKSAKLYLGKNNQLNSSKSGCGIAVSEGAGVSVGSNNTFNKNATSGAVVQSKGRFAVQGASNTFGTNTRSGISCDHGSVFLSGKATALTNNKQHGISLTSGGVAKITGANTRISGNHNGINASGKGVSLVSSAKGVTVSSNKNNGISLNNKAKATLKYMKFSKNKKVAVYVGKGCSCKYSSTNLTKKGSNRIYEA